MPRCYSFAVRAPPPYSRAVRSFRDEPELDAAIAAVDWLAEPHPGTVHYEPEHIEPSLRLLASSADPQTISLAKARLGNGGLAHQHSGQLFPAAVHAVPILLDILLGDGHPHARHAAASLLTEALQSLPPAGLTRTKTPAGAEIPLCCAMAHVIQARRDGLAALGDLSRGLLHVADTHWSFRVTEVGADDLGTFAVGTLTGRLPSVPDPAECHTGAGWTLIGPVRLEYPATQPVRLRLDDAKPEDVSAGSLLLSSECGECVF